MAHGTQSAGVVSTWVGLRSPGKRADREIAGPGRPREQAPEGVSPTNPRHVEIATHLDAGEVAAWAASGPLHVRRRRPAAWSALARQAQARARGRCRRTASASERHEGSTARTVARCPGVCHDHNQQGGRRTVTLGGDIYEGAPRLVTACLHRHGKRRPTIGTPPSPSQDAACSTTGRRQRRWCAQAAASSSCRLTCWGVVGRARPGPAGREAGRAAGPCRRLHQLLRATTGSRVGTRGKGAARQGRVSANCGTCFCRHTARRRWGLMTGAGRLAAVPARRAPPGEPASASFQQHLGAAAAAPWSP